ncbi:MAG: multiheme c-type cytochrome [Aureliella sp.]
MPAGYRKALGEDLLGDGDDLLGGDGLLSGGSDLLDDADDMSALDSLGPDDTDRIPGAGHGKSDVKKSDFPDGIDPHAEAFANTLYPSAHTCAKCHQKIYDEWRVSAHAYSAVSPMFHAFEQKITELSLGTIGTFCVRCHAPVATQLNYPRSKSIVDAPYVFREGVTCVACHRVKTPFGRVNGERRIEPGNLQAPVYGSVGGDGVAQAIAQKDKFKIKLDPKSKKPGQEIHLQGIKFEQLSKSGFCQPCHQVAVNPGIALEVVWAQYRASPAFKKGITCQDCHMGAVPGKAQGYEYGPAAEMSGKWVNPNRKHSNHVFYGPGNSIAHPGVFPHNEKALRWTIDDWMQFDWRAGWGTKEFEKALKDKKAIKPYFPPVWDSVDERRDARKILDENFELLDYKKATAVAVMEAGAKLEGPFLDSRVMRGADLYFHYDVRNASEGHNNPSGSLGAQPQLWLNVVLTGPRGQHLWESGYLDPNGDLANQHSLYVTQRKIAPDKQLFNLQTQFLITGVKGPDREMYLPVNVDIDQLPFLRPGNIPVSVMNHPPLIRMEAKSIPPLGMKRARYSVPGRFLTEPGTYRITARMRSRMEPIYFMQFCGATPEMQRRMLEQTIDLHPHTVEFTIP